MQEHGPQDQAAGGRMRCRGPVPPAHGRGAVHGPSRFLQGPGRDAGDNRRWLGGAWGRQHPVRDRRRALPPGGGEVRDAQRLPDAHLREGRGDRAWALPRVPGLPAAWPQAARPPRGDGRGGPGPGHGRRVGGGDHGVRLHGRQGALRRLRGRGCEPISVVAPLQGR